MGNKLGEEVFGALPFRVAHPHMRSGGEILALACLTLASFLARHGYLLEESLSFDDGGIELKSSGADALSC